MKRLLKLISTIVAAMGAQLLISNVAHAAVDTCTWTGGGADDNISTAANWSVCDNGNVPENGDSLVFPAVSSASYDVINDSLTSVGGITVLGGTNTSNYTVNLIEDGSPVTLDISGPITIGDNQRLTLTTATSFSADVTVTLNNSNSTFNVTGSTMDLGANILTFTYADFANISTATTYSTLPNVYFLGATSGLLAGSSGTEIIANGVNLWWESTGTSYTGELILNKSRLMFDETANIGSTSAATIMHDSQINADLGAAMTLNEPLWIDGNLFGRTSSLIAYEAIANPSNALEITNTTLFSDIAADPWTGNITFSGTINGAYLIGVSQSYTVTPTTGHLIINATTNNSLNVNGDYIVVDSSDDLSDNQAGQSVIIQAGDTVTINGVRASVIVSAGATLKGSGTVGSLRILASGVLAPGNSPGCINTGNLALSGTFQVEIDGATACSQYDKSNVTGSVDITGATLSVVRLSSYVPALNTVFTIIDNDAGDAVTGTFVGLAQGATTVVNGVTYTISYTGGSGNDVTLTVTGLDSSLGAPNTGFKLLKSNIYSPILVILLAAGAILMQAKAKKN